MSVRALAEEIKALGYDGPNAARIAHIEAGAMEGASRDLADRARKVRVMEVYAVAHALGVPPMSLLAPARRDDARIRMGAATVTPADVRSFTAGGTILSGNFDQKQLFYTIARPEHEVADQFPQALPFTHSVLEQPIDDVEEA